MSKTLLVTFLPRENSNTRQLVDAFKENYTGDLVERRLDEGSVPLLNDVAMKTWWGPATENEVESASQEFIDELKSADNVLLATPMYNWSLPAPMKAWLDLVIRGGQTFEFTDQGANGLLETKNAGLLVTTGMTDLGSEGDHLVPVVETAFGLMSKAEFTWVGASNLLVVGEEKAAELVSEAVEKAADLGKKWSE